MVYLNVLFWVMGYALSVWLPNSCIKLQFGYQTQEFGYQIPAGDRV